MCAAVHGETLPESLSPHQYTSAKEASAVFSGRLAAAGNVVLSTGKGS